MKRVNKILENEEYNSHLKKNKKREKGREFCKHNMRHLLDVARIAYIMNLEGDLGYSKDIIYAAALLHDIGKHEQYDKNIPHEKSSAIIANNILKECGYNSDEIYMIVNAILAHRNKDNIENTLDYLLYRADKLSRNCFNCKANEKCNWSEEKKNKNITL